MFRGKSKAFSTGLICHFYISQGKKQKQYYSKVDYAYFNLFNDLRDFLVKGTPHHEIKSKRGKHSPVPCLNCFEINAEFCKALKKLRNEGNEKFELRLVFNKRRIKNYFGKKLALSVPITLKFAQRVGKILGVVKQGQKIQHQYRFFM